MFVCICNSVTDSQIVDAVQQGRASSLQDLGEELKVGTCCGRCKDCARKVLNEARAEAVPVAFEPGFEPALSACS